MRTVLTTVAILIIVVLTAALVGPMLIDWSRQRAFVEARLAHLIGVPVRIEGKIALQLLPSPRLDIGQLEIGGGAGTAGFSAREAHLELAIAALAHGEYEFDEATFVEPQLNLVRSAAGNIAVPLAMDARRDVVRLDKLVFKNGRLVILDAGSGEKVQFEGLTLDAEASSLAGPFRGSGSARGAGGPIRFHFSTGMVAARRLPLKAGIAEGAGLPRIDLDGALVLPPKTAVAAAPVSFVGNVNAGSSAGGGSGASPWTLSGVLSADAEHAALAKFDLRVGENLRAIRAAGSAEVAFGEHPAARASLALKQIDLDTQLGRDTGGVLRPRDGLDRLRTALGTPTPFAGGRMPVSVDFTVAQVTLGGDLVSDVSGSVATHPGAPLRVVLAAQLPAQSRIRLDGTYTSAPAPGYAGHLEFATQDRAKFVAWAGQGDAAAVAMVNQALPFRAITASGEAEVGGGGFALRTLNASLDRSNIAGNVAFTMPAGSDRARLSANLKSDALELDSLPNVGSLIAASPAFDIDLDIAAKGVRIARLGDTAVQSGAFDLKLSRTAEATKLERLHVADLGGASLDAHGAADANGGRFEAALDAPDLTGLAALAQHLLPDRLAAAVTARAGALSPAKLHGTFDLAPGDQLTTLETDGTVGATHIRAKMGKDPRAKDAVVAEAELESADTGQLLRQFGAADAALAQPANDTPPHQPVTDRLALKAAGPWSGDLEASLNGSLAGMQVGWQGRLTPSLASLQGPVSLNGPDLAPLLRSLGIVAANAPGLPAKLKADLDVGAGRTTLTQLSGSFGGARLSGQATLAEAVAASDGTAPVAQLTGTLALDKLALAAVSGLVLGPPPPIEKDAVWSARQFAAVPVTLPETHVDLHIAALDLGFATARGADLSVALAPGLLRVELAPAAIASHTGLTGGTLGGVATVRRGATTVSLSGRLAASDVTLDRPFAHGKLTGNLDFAGTGDTPRGLVAGLAGKGSMTLAGADLPQIDPKAITRTIAALDAETLPLEAEAVDRNLTRSTSRAAVSAPTIALPLLLASGSLRFGPATVPAPSARLDLTGAFDLRQLAVEVTQAVTLMASPPAWPGDPPRITVAWSGPWKAPGRSVESAGFFSGLSARALAINLQRLTDFDADVRERAFFNRRLKVMREQEAQDRHDAAVREAAERARQEEERRRQAEERRRQEEAKRQADQRAAAERARLDEAKRQAEQAAEKRRLDDILRDVALPPNVGTPNIPGASPPPASTPAAPPPIPVPVPVPVPRPDR